jgi:hypothetical protein
MLRASPGLLAALVLVVAAGAAAGCGNIAFDVDQDIPATTIFGDPTGGVLSATGAQELTLDIRAETESRHTGPASAAYLKELTFTVTQPANGTFYFASQVSIYLTPKNPASALQSVKIANLDPVPAETTIRLVPIPGVNMLPYSEEGANITATATGFFPTEDTTYVGHVVVEVRI